MLNRLMGVRILLIVALASAVAFAQNVQRGTQRGQAGTVGKPFDPHDLSGFWDITNTGLPRGALNETSNNRPQMTPWGLEKFHKTKTGVANALSNGFYPNQKDWNDPIRWCDPTGFPRIMWNPTPAGMRFAQANDEVIQFFQNNRVWRDIWTDGRKLPSADAESRSVTWPCCWRRHSCRAARPTGTSADAASIYRIEYPTGSINERSMKSRIAAILCRRAESAGDNFS